MWKEEKTMPPQRTLRILLFAAAISLLSCHKQPVEKVTVKRATLDNGLRVVVVATRWLTSRLYI